MYRGGETSPCLFKLYVGKDKLNSVITKCRMSLTFDGSRYLWQKVVNRTGTRTSKKAFGWDFQGCWNAVNSKNHYSENSFAPKPFKYFSVAVQEYDLWSPYTSLQYYSVSDGRDFQGVTWLFLRKIFQYGTIVLSGGVKYFRFFWTVFYRLFI